MSATVAGTYVAHVNGVGCPSYSNPVTIIKNSTIYPSISISGPLSQVVGQPVTINAVVGNAGPTYSINWRNNGVWFATTTVPSVTYTKQPGTDILKATVSSTSLGCYDSTISNTKVVSESVGITETMKTEGMEVYPNPFENVITVKGLRGKDNLTLVDITGRIVYTSQANRSTEVFTIDNLSPGHYLLKIMNEMGAVRVNVPVVKQ